MIRFRDVSYRHSVGRQHADERLALEGITLDIPQGSFLWLTGPSGAGKSSLLRLMHLEITPCDGHLEILGIDIRTAKRKQRAHLRQRIGYIPQDQHLLTELSVFDNIALPLRLAGTLHTSTASEIRALLSWLSLEGRENAFPDQLSSGERQRVAIARAFIIHPSLLLADEPINALAEDRSRHLIEALQILSRAGTTVIVATHNEALIRTVPSPVVTLNQGRITGCSNEAKSPS